MRSEKRLVSHKNSSNRNAVFTVSQRVYKGEGFNLCVCNCGCVPVTNPPVNSCSPWLQVKMAEVKSFRF